MTRGTPTAPLVILMAWWAFALTALLLGTGLTFGVRGHSLPGVRGLGPDQFLWVVATIAFSTAGAVVVTRSSVRVVGWLMIGIGGSYAVNFAAQHYAASAYDSDPVALGGGLAAWLTLWSWAPAFGLIGLLLVYFPTGAVPGRGWLWVPWAAGVSYAVLAVGAARIWPHRGLDFLRAGDIGAVPDGALLGVGANVGMMSLAASGAIALLVRFRRSFGIQRRQLKVLMLASTLLVAAAVVAVSLPGEDPINQPGLAFLAFTGIAAIPVAVGIAILRYRLYEIDRLVSRTVSYALVTALAVGLFSLVVVVPTSIVGSHDAPPALIAVGTLVAAAAFNPLRRRIQAAVDRRFNRARYDAQMVADGFATRLREPRDLEVVTADLAGTVAATMQPDRFGVWVRT